MNKNEINNIELMILRFKNMTFKISILLPIILGIHQECTKRGPTANYFLNKYN